MARLRGDQFDWNLLHSFLAVLDAGSFTKAAGELHVQQPTLSRHVADLESQLGAPLFERTGRGIAPTAAALAIADSARQMALQADTLSQSLQRKSRDTSGTIRISASDIAAAYLLPPIVSSLQVEHPGIQVTIVASNELSNLLRREADIAVRMVRTKQKSLIMRKLANVAVVACAHSSYLERAGVPREPKDLLKHRLIGYETDDSIERGAARLGLSVAPDAFATRTDDQIAYGRLIAAGVGIGFVARYNLRYLPGVVEVLPQLEIPSLPCYLVVHREIRSNQVVRCAFDHLAARIPMLVT